MSLQFKIQHLWITNKNIKNFDLDSGRIRISRHSTEHLLAPVGEGLRLGGQEEDPCWHCSGKKFNFNLRILFCQLTNCNNIKFQTVNDEADQASLVNFIYIFTWWHLITIYNFEYILGVMGRVKWKIFLIMIK